MASPELPPDMPGRVTYAQWALEIVRGLTLQNVLTMALLIVIAIPSWFAYRFMQDKSFRDEFTSSTSVVDMKVPCLVVRSDMLGRNERFAVAVEYDNRDRMEYMIAAQSPGLLGDDEVEALCAKVHQDVALMRQAVRQRESLPTAPAR